MEYTHSIKDLKKLILSQIQLAAELNQLSEKKDILFTKAVVSKIKEIELYIKKLKLELKNLNLESKQIEKVLKEGKDVLSIKDFADTVPIQTEKLTFKDLALLLILHKPVVEIKELVHSKIRSKYLPIESWSEEKIAEVFSDLKEFPSNKDIYYKLPKVYKPKSVPKKRQDVINKIIEVQRKTRAGYIADKI
ncbi:MAG TPA: hypothetical protein PK453_25155 [Leptospiraceae bacterium]|nr:hypothetical protein [Leptospiraceae bacterium]